MKSKFGLIPIVLPVLVMVLIIGLINIGNAPWVEAQLSEKTNEMPTSTEGLRIPVAFTALGTGDADLDAAGGGIQDTSDGAYDGGGTTHRNLNFGLASTSRLGDAVRQQVVVGTASKNLRIGYNHAADVAFTDYSAEVATVKYRVSGSGNAGFVRVPNNAGTAGSQGHILLLETGNNLIEFEVLYEYTEGAGDAAVEKYWTSYHRVNVVLPREQETDALEFVKGTKDISDLQGAWYRYEEGIQIYRFGLQHGLIELPKAMGGSGDYTYKLLDITSDDAGTGQLPAGMRVYDSSTLQVERNLDTTTSVQVNGVDKLTLVNDSEFDTDGNGSNKGLHHVSGSGAIQDTDGATTLTADNFPLQLGGRPSMVSANDIDTYFLRYEVEDNDTNKTISIDFQIEVHRLPLDAEVPTVRPVAAPYAMLATYTGLDRECNVMSDGPVTVTEPDLSVRYNPDKFEYDVTVPTTIDTVDLRVAVDSSTVVYMNRNRASGNYIRAFSLAAGDAAQYAPNVTSDGGLDATVGAAIKIKMRGAYRQIEHKSSDKIHLWSVDMQPAGVRGSETTFTFRVVEGEAENTYVVNVHRKPDVPARFSNEEADPQIYRFFQGAMVDQKLPDAVDGNNSTGTWRYSLYRTTADDDVSDREDFVGLRLNSSTRVLTGTANPAGTGTSTPHKSSAIGIYRVHDGDCNVATETETDSQRRRIATKDSDELDFQVHVYRDASLHSYHYTTAGGGLGETRDIEADSDAKAYMPSSADEYTTMPYTYMDIEEYQYDVDVPAGATTTDVTLVLNVHDSSTVSVNGAAAERTAGGSHEATLGLMQGDNAVEVRVRNGRVIAMHKLNLRLSGPSVETLMVNAGGMNLLSGDDAYDKFTFSYEVETFYDMVTVETTPLSQYPDAEVKVNGTPESNVQSVTLNEGRNTITVTVSQGGQSQTYTVVVVREDNVAPTFDDEKADIRVQVGKAVPSSLGMLPMASGGNGDLSYMISGLPSGLMLSSSTDANGDMMYMVSGTPDAPGPYEQDFTVTWKAEDADADMVDDAAMQMFTITVTNEEIDYGEAPGTPDTATAGADALISVEVSYMAGGQTTAATLMPEFVFSTTDYTVDVPDDYTKVYVTAIRKSADASVHIGNVVLTDDVNEHEFSAATISSMSNMITITVDPAGNDLDSQDYTITVSTVSDSDASFAGTDIEDITAVAGMMLSVELPEATSGNAPFTYSLEDHNGDAVGAGLMFDADSRMLSGTSTLDMGTTKAVYMMTYMVEDADGDMDEIDFMLTVCEGDESGCTAGGGTVEPEPTYAPEGLMVDRDGMSATITWTPASESASQEVAAVDLDNITASVIATMATLDGEASSHTFSGLMEGVNYAYVVISYDGDGNYKDADGNGYWAVAMDGN